MKSNVCRSKINFLKPRDLMKNADIPVGLNLSLSVGVSLLLIFQLILVPILFQDHLLIGLCIILLMVPFNTPLWSLIHEAIHYKLHPHKLLNEGMGRALCVLFGASFNVLRFGHIMHHRFNRTWESEYYDHKRQHFIIATIAHYFKMLGGLYLYEVLSTFALTLTPVRFAQKMVALLFPSEEQRHAVLNSLLKEQNIRKIREDCFFIFALYGGSFYLMGEHWPILALLLAGRAVVISLMDNAYHYDTPLDNSVAAKELYAPVFVEKFILNFNYHLTHHENAHLSWIQLKEYHTLQKHDYSGDLIPALLAQFKGPITQDKDNNNSHLAV